MENFDDILIAGTEAIDPNYFLLPVHGAVPVYRERVYCYELYHQLRSRWAPGAFLLNGEIDKQGHPYFPETSRPKPDFLVHVPGGGNNYAVIEVKSSQATNAGLRKDLKTLQRFRAVGYARALLLMYGVEPHTLLERVHGCGAPLELREGVELWAHTHPYAPAVMVGEGLH